MAVETETETKLLASQKSNNIRFLQRCSE